MMQRKWLARGLAAILLSARWTSQELESRAAEFLGLSSHRSARRIIRRMMRAVPTPYPPSPGWIASHLLSSGLFKYLTSIRRRKKELTATPVPLEPPRPAPLPALADLKIPPLATPGDLADWLGLPLEQLDWLADSKRLHRRTALPILQHYSYAFIPRRNRTPRLIEAPKPRLRAIQRRILHEILVSLQPHHCAHAFVRGRSCLSGAQVHAGEDIVLAMDLRRFFTHVPISRVHAIFRSLGYPTAVARLLTGLCTTSTPASVFTKHPEGQQFDWLTRKLYGDPHLAQGAPTSPALANLSSWRLDQRLAGLARSFGANYTRYADDLTFSGDRTFAARIMPFQHLVAEITRNEGFALNRDKTRIMRQAARQQVTGIVVNRHLNISRKTYDALKAVLHNCVRYGPSEQNRQGARDFRAHLDGRVAWIEALNPQRGARLRAMFNAIQW
jgi:RNA-directed DNA polymerase